MLLRANIEIDVKFIEHESGEITLLSVELSDGYDIRPLLTKVDIDEIIDEIKNQII